MGKREYYANYMWFLLGGYFRLPLETLCHSIEEKKGKASCLLMSKFPKCAFLGVLDTLYSIYFVLFMLLVSEHKLFKL